MKKLVISAIGKDRPGIIAAVTRILFYRGYNIEDTTSTILEDHFAMLFIVTAPLAVDIAELSAVIEDYLRDYAMHVDIHEIETKKETIQGSGTPALIAVSGLDKTGIVFHIAEYLANKSINIAQLSTKRLSRDTHETLFLMNLEVDLPTNITIENVQADLLALAEKEHIEIHVEPLEVYTL